jgi:DNA polymerase I-like protein with 3'-5' exonuclease and polymerase domains
MTKFHWQGTEVQEGMAKLHADFLQWKPNVVLLLGPYALHAAKSSSTPPKKLPFPLSLWRGSIFVSDVLTSPFYGIKCVPSLHPLSVFAKMENSLFSRYDFRRVAKEGMSPIFIPTPRNIQTEVTLDYIVERLTEIRQRRTLIALDIEGYVHNLRCLSIATSPADVFIIPFTTMNGDSWWDAQSESILWEQLGLTLGDENVPKVLQNGLYDQFVLAYGYGVLIRNIVDDTMLKHWEHFHEVKKSLDVQTSIYTREPYYKSGRKAMTAYEFHRYCCLDSAVTYEINSVLEGSKKKWPQEVADHYRFNIQLLKPMLYMDLRGMRFDNHKRNQRVAELREEAAGYQNQLNSYAGHPVNVRSPQQMISFLYRELGLPSQYKRRKSADEEERETADYQALLKLAKRASGGHAEILMTCIRLRERLKRASDLKAIGLDDDGRCRFSYIIPGSVSGRLACRASATGSGTAGQTIREIDRDLFIADEGYDIAQEDLSGADGWTVAAHCAALGDSTMLEDLLAGLKIPMMIGLTVRHGPVLNQYDRATLRTMQSEIKKGSNFHFALKQTQHGTNYGMSHSTVGLRVFLESYGEIVITDAEAKRYQDAYFDRYKGIKLWHEWVRQQIRKGYLTTAAGSRRIISGRKDDDTLRRILAHEPQMNTTYVTNTAANRSYYDPSNRYPNGRPIVENVHQMHDALVNQWRMEEREFALTKLKEWFNLTLNIRGYQIRVPFEGAWGTSWGDLNVTI